MHLDINCIEVCINNYEFNKVKMIYNSKWTE
jgi:hypothetical protein